MEPAEKKPKGLRGDVIITIAMLMFGSYALFFNLLPNIPIISFLFIMQVVGMVAFFFIAIRQGFPKVTSKGWWVLMALAIVATGNDLTYFYALRLTSVANATVAHQFVSIFLLFLGPLLLHEQTKKNEWVALAVSLLGIVVIFCNGFTIGASDVWGIVLGLVSALCYAFLIVIFRYLPKKMGYTTSFMNFWRYTFSTILLLPAIPFFGGFHVIYQNIWVLAGFGLLFAVIASGIHNFGISQTRPLHVSIIGKSEPVIATVYALLFLGQVPTTATIIGGVLIIGASAWLVFNEEN
jgi:drug/metabolite transporter (DMT)-like permease